MSTRSNWAINISPNYQDERIWEKQNVAARTADGIKMSPPMGALDHDGEGFLRNGRRLVIIFRLGCQVLINTCLESQDKVIHI